MLKLEVVKLCLTCHNIPFSKCLRFVSTFTTCEVGKKYKAKRTLHSLCFYSFYCISTERFSLISLGLKVPDIS